MPAVSSTPAPYRVSQDVGTIYDIVDSLGDSASGIANRLTGKLRSGKPYSRSGYMLKNRPEVTARIRAANVPWLTIYSIVRRYRAKKLAVAAI